jgi:FlaA1/EpsC-like NDP-sugar epimerase
MISLDQGVELVYIALQDAIGGEIFVKKIPSMRVVDIAEAIAPELPTKIIGMRPGEKLHEQMISVEDSPHTYEFSDYYKIIPSWSMPKKGNTVIIECDSLQADAANRVGTGFSYSSDSNDWWLSPTDLRQMLDAAQARGSASDIRSTDYAPLT